MSAIWDDADLFTTYAALRKSCVRNSEYEINSLFCENCRLEDCKSTCQFKEECQYIVYDGETQNCVFLHYCELEAIENTSLEVYARSSNSTKKDYGLL